jgi:catechol 2,3-dioxygenase-like lactoylglutathione lyase family enzyme
MPEIATPNLPSSDFDRTEAFYGALGFKRNYRDTGWMILKRGALVVEFFPMDIDPKESWFSVCFRTTELDTLFAEFLSAPLSLEDRTGLRLSEIKTEPHGIRLFYMSDPDGSLIRCIDESYQP